MAPEGKEVFPKSYDDKDPRIYKDVDEFSLHSGYEYSHTLIKLLPSGIVEGLWYADRYRSNMS
jgi:hypothetical protein